MNYIVLNPVRVKNEALDKKTILACHGCLETKGKLFGVHGRNLGQAFTDLTGMEVYKAHLCYICISLLQRFREFRVRCQNSSYILHQAATLNEDLHSIDRTKLQHNIAATDVLTLSYDPLQETTEELLIRRKENVENYETTVDLSTDDEIDTKFTDNDEVSIKDDTEQLTNNDEISVNDSTEQAIIKSLNKTNESCNDFEKTKDYIVKKEADSEMVNENTINEENESSDDDFSWPIENYDLLCNDASMIDVTDNQNVIKETDQDSVEIETTKNQNVVEQNVKKNKEIKTRRNVIKQNDQNKNEIKTKKTKNEKVCPEKYKENQIFYIMDVGQNLKEDELMKQYTSVQERISHVFTTLRKQVKRNKGSFHKMFESFYTESLQHTVDYDEDDLDDDKKLIWQFLSLQKRLGDICSLNIEFLSVEKQMEEMEEKRSSGKYEKEHCNMCCKKFVLKETLQRHINLKHNRNFRFKCSVCLYRFNRTFLYWKHLFTHNRRITCRICGVFFCGSSIFRGQLIEHMKIHEGKKVVCEFCDSSWKNSKLLTMHLRHCHRDKLNVVKCLLCGDTYNGALGLQCHMTRMHREAMKCKKCKVYFASAEAVTAHLKDDGCTSGQSSCAVCGANFAAEKLMMEHYYKQCSRTQKLKQKKQRKIKKQILKIKTKKTTENKTRHRREIGVNLICEYCGKDGFKVPATLRYHQRVHTGEKPYKCHVCGKFFRFRPSWKTHLLTHTGERRYQCHLCAAVFIQSAHLKRHEQGHTDEKPFTCDICTKCFKTKPSLAEHIQRIHQGIKRKPRVKPYTCEICERSFRQKTILVQHIRRVHEELNKRRKRT